MAVFDKALLAKILFKARGERNSEEYARDSGVSRSYISMLLNGKRDDPPTPDILKKLAAQKFSELMNSL